MDLDRYIELRAILQQRRLRLAESIRRRIEADARHLNHLQVLCDATTQGLCILAASGRMQGQTLLLHGVHPQTGATPTAYELTPTSDTGLPGTTSVTQERLS